MNTSDNRWDVIFIAPSAIEAHSAKNYLVSEGIEALIQNEIAAQVYGNAVDKPKILIKEADVEKATAVLLKGGYLK